MNSAAHLVPHEGLSPAAGAIRTLEAHLPPEATVTRPAGGYLLWARLPGPPESERETCRRLLAGGVRVAPGRPFFGAAPSTPYARLSIACVDEESVAEGCRRFATVLREIVSPDRVTTSRPRHHRGPG
jgi:DNA-binding transcriptional MocR family regulator